MTQEFTTEADAKTNSTGPRRPPHEVGGAGPARFAATVDEIWRHHSDVQWLWEGYIPSASLVGLAASEGVGKTRTMMDWHRRVQQGLPWPDNQPCTIPPGSPALWLCADGQHREIAGIVAEYGMTGASIVFPAPLDSPFEGTEIDSLEMVGPGGWLDRGVKQYRPWIVVIDTLTFATGRNLCNRHVIKEIKATFERLCRTHGVSVAMLLNFSREEQRLGRRIKELTHTLIHLDAPDPEGQPDRLKLWAEKSFGKNPPALGVTMGTGGNTYDFNPPVARKPNRGGRPPKGRSL